MYYGETRFSIAQTKTLARISTVILHRKNNSEMKVKSDQIEKSLVIQ